MAVVTRTIQTKSGAREATYWVLGPKEHTKPKYSKKEQKARKVERDRAATLLADELKKAAAARKAAKRKAAAEEAEAKAAAEVRSEAIQKASDEATAETTSA